MTKTIFVDPSVAGPDLLFSTGTVAADGAEQFAAALPEIGGSADTGWNITQWNTPASEIFDPAAPVLADAADDDPVLGTAIASWHTGTATSGSGLVVYGGPGTYTYALTAAGGGTRDTFLQTTGYAPGAVTFAHPITFTAEERLAAASAGDGGTAIAFNSFTVFFNEAGSPGYDASKPTDEVFLQVPLTDFRGEPGPYETISKGNYDQTIYNLSSQSVSATDAVTSDASVNALGFAADDGALHTVSIDLSQALLRLVDQMALQDPADAAAFLDFSRWSIGSVYAGVETSSGPDGDAVPGGALTLDIAHPTLTEDTDQTASSSMAPSTVQSIDGNGYANDEDAGIVATLSGTVNAVRLTGTGIKTVTSRGSDSVTVGDGQTVALHADGTGLAVDGQIATFGGASIDGTAPLSVSGSFGTLDVSSAAAGDTITGSASGAATVTLNGSAARLDLSSAATVTLGGDGDQVATSGGIVSLSGADIGQNAAIDLDGGGTQTVFLNGRSGAVTETGSGTQVVVASAGGQDGSVQLTGGAGTQTLWTGGATATVTGSNMGMGTGSAGSLAIHAQAGSHVALQLGAERTTLDDEGGTVIVQGASDPAASAFVSGGAGRVTVQGGAEQLVAAAGTSADGLLQVVAGSGAQTIFGGAGTVTAIGSHATAGSQVIVNGADPDAVTTIFGGLTRQTIWTGQAHDTIVSSDQAGDASGSIAAIIQGGTSAYWGGTESASLTNGDGILDAFLRGDGAVSILASMTGTGRTTLTGFNPLHDTLTLGGLSDPSAVQVAYGGGNATLSVGGSAASVILVGVSHVDLSPFAGGVAVTV